jgi:hypothetical protein
VQIRKRVRRAPIKVKLLVQVAEQSDKVDDPSIAWPDTRKQIELGTIADNLSAQDEAGHRVSADAPQVQLHFTPAYSSWLNQVELWFAKIERDVIARGIFTSVKDLAKKLMRYIRRYNTAPKIVKWKYCDPSRRISTQLVVTGH